MVGSSIFRKWLTCAHDLAPLPVTNRAFGGSVTSDQLFFFDQIVPSSRAALVVWYCGSTAATAVPPDSVHSVISNSKGRSAARGFLIRAVGPTAVAIPAALNNNEESLAALNLSCAGRRLSLKPWWRNSSLKSKAPVKSRTSHVAPIPGIKDIQAEMLERVDSEFEKWLNP